MLLACPNLLLPWPGGLLHVRGSALVDGAVGKGTRPPDSLFDKFLVRLRRKTKKYIPNMHMEGWDLVHHMRIFVLNDEFVFERWKLHRIFQRRSRKEVIFIVVRRAVINLVTIKILPCGTGSFEDEN